MAENPIKYSDIISPDVEKGLSELTNTLKLLDVAVEDSKKLIKQLGAEIKEAGFKDMAKLINALAVEEKKLAEIERQRELTNRKLEQSATERARAEKEVQKQIKLKNDTENISLKNALSQKGAYKQLSDQLNLLRKEYKDLAASEDVESTKAKEMLKNIKKLDDQLKKIDATVGQHQRSVGQYGKAWESAKTTIKGWGVAALAAVGAAELWQTALKQSDILADKWEKTVSGARATLGYFATAIMTMDFSNFWDGLTTSINSAIELTEALDEIQDRKRGIELMDSKLELQQARLEKIFKDRSKSDAVRLDAAAEYAQNEINATKIKLDLQKTEYDARVKSLALQSKISESDARYFVENYDRIQQLVPVYNYINELKNAGLDLDAQNYMMLNNISAKELKFYNDTNPKLQDKKELLDEASKSYSGIYKLLTAYEQATLKTVLVETKIGIAAEKKNKAIEKSESKTADFTLDNAKKLDKELAELEKKNKDEIESKREAEKQNALDYADFMIELKKKEEDEKTAYEKEQLEKRKQQQEQFFETSKSVINSFFQAENAIREMRKQKELQAAGDDLELQKRINKEYARRERNMAIFEINLSTAVAVAKASQKGYPAALPEVIAISAEGAAQLITVEAQYQALKFRKGGHGEIYSKNPEMDKTYIPGVGWAGKGEYFSIFNKEATAKHQPLISDFTDAVNQNKLDLFALNFIPKITQGNNDKLSDIAIQQLAVQRQTKEILAKQKILRGKTEIDLNGNRTHYC